MAPLEGTCKHWKLEMQRAVTAPSKVLVCSCQKSADLNLQPKGKSRVSQHGLICSFTCMRCIHGGSPKMGSPFRVPIVRVTVFGGIQRDFEIEGRDSNHEHYPATSIALMHQKFGPQCKPTRLSFLKVLETGHLKEARQP